LPLKPLSLHDALPIWATACSRRAADKRAQRSRESWSRSTPLPAFLLEFYMHQDRTVILQGQRFHYTEWGEATAPALVLLHGVTGHARTWDDEAGALASRYRVLALDQRG